MKKLYFVKKIPKIKPFKGYRYLVIAKNGSWESSKYFTKKVDAQKVANKMNKEIQGNPSISKSIKSIKGWIPVQAIRQLSNGSIQLKIPKGTMSNPGKRKSFLNKVGKVFGKVVKTGKGITA